MGRLLVQQLPLVGDSHLFASTSRARVRVVAGPAHVEEGRRKADGQVARVHLYRASIDIKTFVDDYQKRRAGCCIKERKESSRIERKITIQRGGESGQYNFSTYKAKSLRKF